VTTNYETREHDVLVIGAGGAGLRASLEALAQGASVGVICKSLLGKAHTVMAEGGIAAAMAHVDSADNWKTHFRDTMRGGKLLNNWRMAQLHAQESPERVRELEQWGALFDRTEKGDILQRAFGGHTFKRLCHVGDRTGLEMIRTLQDRGVQQGIDVYMECTVTRLLTDGGRVTGAFAYWREAGRFIVFKARAIVIATGGIGKAWRITSNSWEYTGDGMALAYEAGAELMDMEFVQFHPTGMVWPPGVQGILVTEAVRGEGGILRNKAGERFMEKYDPKRMELSTRDVVARSIYTEVKEGRGTEHGGAYLDISHKAAEYVKKKLPSMYHQFKELADVDITKGPMEVGPTCHYMMGGIRVEAETAQSTISGLFAAGEAAAGLHGSNRLGGNSLSDLLVFGRRAGLAAAEYAKRAAASSFDNSQIDQAEKELLAPFSNSGTESPYAVQRDLQEVMQNLVGIYRTKEDLEKALVELGKLKVRTAKASVEGSRLFNPGWHLSYDLKAMLIVSEAVTLSALARTESRGAHSRLDYPNVDPVWEKKHNIIVRESGAMKRRESPLEAMPEDLQQILAEDRS
jgi:succinate dehydrogenase / fumarate reductase flavoprotein subunit